MLEIPLFILSYQTQALRIEKKENYGCSKFTTLVGNSPTNCEPVGDQLRTCNGLQLRTSNDLQLRTCNDPLRTCPQPTVLSQQSSANSPQPTVPSQSPANPQPTAIQFATNSSQSGTRKDAEGRSPQKTNRLTGTTFATFLFFWGQHGFDVGFRIIYIAHPRVRMVGHQKRSTLLLARTTLRDPAGRGKYNPQSGANQAANSQSGANQVPIRCQSGTIKPTGAANRCQQPTASNPGPIRCQHWQP